MRIDSIMPTRVSPGQSVIVQGEGLETATRVLFGEQDTPFQVDGETLVVPVPESSGTVAVTVEGAEGSSNTVNIDIAASNIGKTNDSTTASGLAPRHMTNVEPAALHARSTSDRVRNTNGASALVAG